MQCDNEGNFPEVCQMNSKCFPRLSNALPDNVTVNSSAKSTSVPWPPRLLNRHDGQAQSVTQLWSAHACVVAAYFFSYCGCKKAFDPSDATHEHTPVVVVPHCGILPPHLVNQGCTHPYSPGSRNMALHMICVDYGQWLPRNSRRPQRWARLWNRLVRLQTGHNCRTWQKK